MFAKLLKHEWKANAPLLGVLSGAAIGIGLLGGIAMQLTSFPREGDVNEMLSEVFSGLSYGFVMLALFLYVAAVGILLLYRFYKNKFAEQGYLTFTLPVTGHQILLSSLASTLIWELIAVITAIASVSLMSLISSIGQEITVSPTDVKDIITDIGGYMNDGELLQLKNTMALVLLQIPTACIYGTVLMMTSITMGAAWAKKHKLLAAFGIFYGATCVLRVVSNLVTGIVAISGSVLDNPFLTMQTTMISSVVMEVLLSVGAYFLAHHMITRKLNLK